MPPVKRPGPAFVALAAVVLAVVVIIVVFVSLRDTRGRIALDLETHPAAVDEPSSRPADPGTAAPTKPITPRRVVDVSEAGLGEAIAGFVRNEASVGVEGALCELFENTSPLREQCQEGESRGRAPTSPEGFFAFDHAPSLAERYLLKVTHPMYATEKRPIDLARGAATITVTLRAGTSVSGAVTAATGSPLPNATLLLYDANQAAADPNGSIEVTATTDSNGLYTLGHVNPGMKHLRASLPGYATAFRSPLRVDLGKALTKVDFTLSEGAAIAGRILAQGPGAPIDAAWITARPTSGSALPIAVHPQADGGWVIDGAQAGRPYVVGVSAAGFLPPLQQTVTAPALNVDFVLAPSARIVGRVVDDETGKPPAIFTIGISTASDETVLSAFSKRAFGPPAFNDGRFEYVDLAPGRYWVMAEARGYAGGRSSEVVIGAGERREGVEIRLIRGATVKGRVVDSKGAPVAGATVEADQARDASSAVKNVFEVLTRSIRRDLREAKTGKDGTFALTNLLPGSYALNVRHPDFSPATTPPIAVPASGEQASPDVVLAQGGTIRGRIRLPDGSPDPKAAVQILGIGPALLSAPRMSPTDSDGRFEVTGLATGQYRVLVAQRNGQPDLGVVFSQMTNPNLVTLGEGEVKELEL